ncbi:MAG: hypothetical protein ACFCGT_12925 [Sandaracinaceae bacterium]
MAGGEDQARRLVPVLLESLRDADEARLRELLAEAITAVGGRRHDVVRPRSYYIQRVLTHARRVSLPADRSVEEMVDLPLIRVTRAAVYWNRQPLPQLLRPTDLVVEVPIREPARQALGLLLAWQVRGILVVRPGTEPRIVAL